MCADAHQVATYVAHLGVAGRHARQDEDDGACATNGHTARLLPCDGFAEDEKREHHGEDGHRGGDDAGVDGRGDAQADGEQTLVENHSQQGRATKQQHVAHGNMLAFGKLRSHPEQQGGTHHAKTNHRQTVDAVVHGVFAHWRHQSPHGLSGKHAEVGL